VKILKQEVVVSYMKRVRMMNFTFRGQSISLIFFSFEQRKENASPEDFFHEKAESL